MMQVIPASQVQLSTGPVFENLPDDGLHFDPALMRPDVLRRNHPANAATRIAERRRERMRQGLPRLFAEGDSWLAYPLPLFSRSNLVEQLQHIGRGTLVIDDEASNGDEAVEMLCGGSKRRLFEKHLYRTDYDILLFSGGGNDIVGNLDMPFFLIDQTPQHQRWQDVFNQTRFDRRLSQIRHAYLDLIEMSLEYAANPHLRLVTHTYDLAVPSSRGTPIGNHGPWMHPYLEERGITDPAWQRAIAEHMLSSFGRMLRELADQLPDLVHPSLRDRCYPDSRRFTVVDTQGLLTPDHADDWIDEIHPTPAGFRTVAEHIWEQGIDPLLPLLAQDYH